MKPPSYCHLETFDEDSLIQIGVVFGTLLIVYIGLILPLILGIASVVARSIDKDFIIFRPIIERS